MSRRRTRQIIIIVLLILLLAALGLSYAQYRSTRKLGLDLNFAEPQVFPAPEYLYSFAGEGAEVLARPLGVLVDGNRVYVTDSRRSSIDVFTVQGTRVGKWGEEVLNTPLYIAKNPRTGDFYVSDRRRHGVFIFGSDGTAKGEFNPKLPKNQRPRFKTNGVQWAPVALAFGSDGTLYVTEILNGHRVLIFDPQGTFVRAFGDAGLAANVNSGEGAFQFPNSIKITETEVWVADSNNRRIQVFTRDGEFKRFLATQGLPRGFDFLPKTDPKDAERIVVVDTLSHDGTIWDTKKSEKVVTFGERGVLEAQFSYPNDTSIGKNRRIYVADSANGRIQVWGWPVIPAVPPIQKNPVAWVLFFAPLAILPFLFFSRRRRYFVTEDFVLALYELGEIDRMPNRRVIWEILPDEYERVREMSQNGVSLESLLRPAEYSDSDARSLQERFELSREDAVALAVAKRAKLFATDQHELRRMAQLLEIDVVNHQEFLDRTPKSARRQEPS